MSRQRYRTPFAFHVAYCFGHRGTYGWEANGTSERAKTELKARLDAVMIQRPLSALWGPSTPKKPRQVIRYDFEPDAKIDEVFREAQAAQSEGHLFKALDRVLELKLDDMGESIFEDVCVGRKVVCWGLTRNSVEVACDAFENLSKSREYATLMRQINLGIWATHGDASEAKRHEAAMEFRMHKGAGIFLATMDCMPEGISLGPIHVDTPQGQELRAGAEVEHFMQLHYSATTMLQAENRPVLKDMISVLPIIYHVAMGSREERQERKLIPQIETLDALTNTESTGELMAAFKDGKRSLEEMLAEMIDAMPVEASSAFDFSGDSGD